MGCDLVVLRYAIPTGIPRIDELSTGPPGFEISQFTWLVWYFGYNNVLSLLIYLNFFTIIILFRLNYFIY